VYIDAYNSYGVKGGSNEYLIDFSFIKNTLKIMLILMMGFMVAGLIIGESRGAVGVGFISSILMTLLLAKKTNIKIGSLGLIGLVAILTMILNTSVIQKQRDYEKAGNVLSDRDKIWNVSIEAAKYYPVFGLGISNWHFIKIEDLKKSVEARNEVFEPKKYSIQYGHSHNLFLTILVERGWVGFSIFIFFMSAWILALIKSYKQTRTDQRFGVVWTGASDSARRGPNYDDFQLETSTSTRTSTRSSQHDKTSIRSFTNFTT
jgi:O-antigen ligase